MNIIVNVITGVVALLHGYFLVLEMFLWEKPAGNKNPSAPRQSLRRNPNRWRRIRDYTMAFFLPA